MIDTVECGEVKYLRRQLKEKDMQIADLSEKLEYLAACMEEDREMAEEYGW